MALVAARGFRRNRGTGKSLSFVWPVFAREVWESYPDEEHVYRAQPPSPQAIERMMETMRWVQWLEVEQRHLVWMRAKQYEWRVICRRFGCERTTAWRRWQRALQIVAGRLNEQAHRAVVF